MELNLEMFKSLHPSRYISFIVPNPCRSHHVLRVSVLDSPIEPTEPPAAAAAMFVPLGLEADWIFTTECGHYQLLYDSPGFSRLIIVGNETQAIDGGPLRTGRCFNRLSEEDWPSSWSQLAVGLQPLFIILSPKPCPDYGVPEIPILTFDDSVKCGVVLEKSIGSSVGEFIVENVEIGRQSETEMSETREFRRRLRFKRMPNLVQTEIRIIPEANRNLDGVEIQNIEFIPETRVLVHPYLPPMAASLSLIGSSIDEQIQTGHRPRALCVGVGGGALLTFLATHLDFEVVGVEIDMEVLRVAEQYFGLVQNEFLHISIGDAIEFLETASKSVSKQNSGSSEYYYDVIMVDLDTSDARKGTSAPPLKFVGRDFLSTVRSVLSEHGILVMNVIPLDKEFFETLVNNFRSVFEDLFRIEVDEYVNFVVIASVRRISSFPRDDVDTENEMNNFLSRLRLLLPGAFIDSIKRI